MDNIQNIDLDPGVVGLAVAKALAERGQNVIVLETADAIGTESSSRNSEVIHSGTTPLQLPYKPCLGVCQLPKAWYAKSFCQFIQCSAVSPAGPLQLIWFNLGCLPHI